MQLKAGSTTPGRGEHRLLDLERKKDYYEITNEITKEHTEITNKITMRLLTRSTVRLLNGTSNSMG